MHAYCTYTVHHNSTVYRQGSTMDQMCVGKTKAHIDAA